ncbi:hypothetical protein M9H77_01885 [Catharanthus roseus]|uniref:Uncharacterized protein n=1 Tax=Catharanthus roseus TaxID=4058 RepID=A0ACC0C790_CATRO|nr:hypothetical protein M9H77_01885 [Catharanthus roseus]
MLNIWILVHSKKLLLNASYSGNLKRIYETDLGLISQCCLTKHVLKVSKQYLSNVSLKINVKLFHEGLSYLNLKLGFRLWHPKTDQRLLNMRDCCRELLLAFKKSTGCKPLRIIFYRDGVSDGQFYQVLLYELDAIRKVSLHILSSCIPRLPCPFSGAHLLAFQACASLEPGYQPPVTFIVVQNRHHT